MFNQDSCPFHIFALSTDFQMQVHSIGPGWLSEHQSNAPQALARSNKWQKIFQLAVCFEGALLAIPPYNVHLHLKRKLIMVMHKWVQRTLRKQVF